MEANENCLSVFRISKCAEVRRQLGGRNSPSNPAGRVGLHWIARHDCGFDMNAFRAFERAVLEAARPG
jgi:hypothetical protein